MLFKSLIANLIVTGEFNHSMYSHEISFSEKSEIMSLPVLLAFGLLRGYDHSINLP